jgi:hypothetical protein
MMASNMLQRRKSRQLLESYYIENRNDIYPLQGYLLTINNTTQMKKNRHTTLDRTKFQATKIQLSRTET